MLGVLRTNRRAKVADSAARKFLRVSALVVLCAAVIAGAFLSGPAYGLLVLVVGGTAWGMVAGLLGVPPATLLVVALATEAVVGYEFKRVYVLDYAGGSPARSWATFLESLFLSDVVLACLMAGAAWAGVRWQRRWCAGGSARHAGQARQP
jgi:hypothetical protein